MGGIYAWGIFCFCISIQTKIHNISVSISASILSLSLLSLGLDSQLFVSQPNIYSCSIPNIFHQELIHMTQMCDKSGSLNIPVRRLAALQSAQGLKFFHFAKSSLYTDGMKGYRLVSRKSGGCLEKMPWLFGTEKWERKEARRPKGKRGFRHQLPRFPAPCEWLQLPFTTQTQEHLRHTQLSF